MVSVGVEAEERPDTLQGTDEELVEATRAGDVHAFAELVERYRDAAYGIALHVLGEPGEAAEAAQDAFFRAYRCLSQLRDSARFSAWLCRIALNLARRRLARRRSAPVVTSLEEVGEVGDPGPSGGEAAERSEVVDIIRQLMQKLPDEQRLTFTLFYVDGYTHKELSEMLTVPVGTVKSRLSSARSRLKEEVVQMARKAMQESRPDAEFWRSATGAISGLVKEAATGKPIQDCRIELAEAQTSTRASTQTDAEGNWEAKELMPGAYAVTARHEAYVPQRYPSDRPGMIGRTSVVVRPGQTVREVDFELQPGAFIDGIVLGPDNAPLVDAAVGVFREREPIGEDVRFSNVPSAGRRTGADGSFKTGPLAAGNYALAVTTGQRDEWGLSRPACFYPGTYSLHDAEWLKTSAGATLNDVLIRLPEAGGVRLRVRVSDAESGLPISGARVLVIRRDVLTDWFTGQTDEDGWFSSEFLTRGPWQITAGAPDQDYARWSNWVDVAAGDSQIERCIALARGAVFEGRIATEDAQEFPPLARLTYTFWPVLPQEVEGHPAWCSWDRDGAHYCWMIQKGPQPEMAAPDGAGRLLSPPIWPGAVKISAEIADRDWRLTGIHVGQRHLSSGETVECARGERVGSFKIVLGTNLGVVAGRVLSLADKTPLAGAWVHLRREDGEPIRIRGAETDRTGSFVVHSVPAGPYSLSVARSQHEPPEEGPKRDIIVQPGGVVHLDLVLADAGCN